MIKNIKPKKETIDSLLVFIFITLIVSASALGQNHELSMYDELWNFSNSYKMLNGFVIYKDLNVIITPLYFYLGTFILSIFGTNLFAFKIYNILIVTSMYFIIYQIFQTTKIKKIRSLLFLIIIYLITYIVILLGASYNILALDFFLLGILLHLKGKNDYIQGIIMFLIFMTKQNIGIYYMIAYLIYSLAEHKKIKKLIIPYIIEIILLAIYFLYLLLNQNLYNFINYTFLGVKEFGKENISIDIYAILFILINIILYGFLIWINLFKKSKFKEKSLVIFSGLALLYMFPIMNEFHIKVAMIPTLATLIIFIEKNFLEELTKNKIYNNIIIILVIGLSINSICRFVNNIKQINNYDCYDIYYGMNIDKEIKDNIDTILNYIKENESQGYEVKILSYKSDLYMNILKRNNGKMDLPFYGNLGKDGVDGLIEEIKQLKNTKLLILNDDTYLYQESDKIRNFIKDNYKKIGEIEEFYIYNVN